MNVLSQQLEVDASGFGVSSVSAWHRRYLVWIVWKQTLQDLVNKETAMLGVDCVGLDWRKTRSVVSCKKTFEGSLFTDLAQL